MPNWSYNNLKINGSKKRLKEFYDFNKSDDEERVLCFYKSVPMPKNIYRGTITFGERYNNRENWYDWNCKNLGTKWNVREARFEEDIIYDQGGFETLLVLNRKLEENVETVKPIIKSFFQRSVYNYYFDTAWSPPVPWLLKTSKKWNDLEFIMDSELEGEDIGYEIKIINGEIIEQRQYSPAEEYYKKNKKGIHKIVISLRDKLKLDGIKYKNDEEKEDIIESIREELDKEYYWFPDDVILSIINELIYKK